jgi:hypothetical protein
MGLFLYHAVMRVTRRNFHFFALTTELVVHRQRT